MAQSPVGINVGSQSFINFDDGGGTVLTQIVTVGTLQGGTLSSIPNIPGGTITNLVNGTLGILTNGSIHVTAGTEVITSGSIAVTAGTITGGTLTNLVSGTINSATAVLNSGTINVATAVITTLPNLPQGSINVTAGTIATLGTMGTLGLLANGTLSSAGTVTGVGTITNLGTLSAGTINIVTPGTATTNLGKAGGNTGGTTDVGVAPMFVQVGTLGTASVEADGQYGAPFMDGNRVAYFNNAYKLDSTNDSITAILDGNGTVAAVTNLVNGTVRVTVGTIAAGTINTGTVNTGTINVATITAGTINTGTINTGTVSVAVGTINHGTIDGGTIQLNPINAGSAIVIAGTTTSGTIGTLVTAPGVGTSIYVTGFQVLQTSGTAESVVSFALQASGNQVLARGNFSAGGGVTEQYTFPSTYGTTNAAITWNQLSGSGTASYKVAYFVHV